MYLFFYLSYVLDYIFIYYCLNYLVLITRFLANIRVDKGFVDFEFRRLFFLISLSMLFSLINDSTVFF